MGQLIENRYSFTAIYEHIHGQMLLPSSIITSLFVISTLIYKLRDDPYTLQYCAQSSYYATPASLLPAGAARLSAERLQ
jgi:hypothetical protein